MFQEKQGDRGKWGRPHTLLIFVILSEKRETIQWIDFAEFAENGPFFRSPSYVSFSCPESLTLFTLK
jgi:hypothetical protein